MPDDSVFKEGFVSAARGALANTALELTILPTEKCNFRCTYCYEDFAIGRMPRSVQDGCIALVASRASELERLEIRWFGGEPLLAIGVVERMSAAFHEIAAGHTRLHYTASMTTNGFLLTLDAAERLASWGVKNYQISLDGPREAHDGTRRLMSRLGSFDRIMANLTALRDSDLDIGVVIRLHLTPANCELMPDFVRHLASEFLPDRRFTLFFMPVAHLGGPSDASTPILSFGQSRDLIRDLRSIAADVLGQPLSAQTTGTDGAWSVCYAAKPNAFVIRADGRIGKCTVALAKPKNSVGTIAIDGRIEMDQSLHRLWLRGWETQDRDALHCPYEALDVLQH